MAGLLKLINSNQSREYNHRIIENRNDFYVWIDYERTKYKRITLFDGFFGISETFEKNRIVLKYKREVEILSQQIFVK